MERVHGHGNVTGYCKWNTHPVLLQKTRNLGRRLISEKKLYFLFILEQWFSMFIGAVCLSISLSVPTVLSSIILEGPPCKIYFMQPYPGLALCIQPFARRNPYILSITHGLSFYHLTLYTLSYSSCIHPSCMPITSRHSILYFNDKFFVCSVPHSDILISICSFSSYLKFPSRGHSSSELESQSFTFLQIRVSYLSIHSVWQTRLHLNTHISTTHNFPQAARNCLLFIFL